MVNWAWCKFCNGVKVKIKKGDTVLIISGKDHGKTGKVLKVFPNPPSARSGGGGAKILVESIALKKHHERPKKSGQRGQTVTMPSPIHVSNAMLFCKSCNKRSRSRICKNCKQKI